MSMFSIAQQARDAAHITRAHITRPHLDGLRYSHGLLHAPQAVRVLQLNVSTFDQSDLSCVGTSFLKHRRRTRTFG